MVAKEATTEAMVATEATREATAAKEVDTREPERPRVAPFTAVRLTPREASGGTREATPEATRAPTQEARAVATPVQATRAAQGTPRQQEGGKHQDTEDPPEQSQGQEPQ